MLSAALLLVAATAGSGGAARVACGIELGREKADRYLAHCRVVAPSPSVCTTASSCSEVVDEIMSGCRFLSERANPANAVPQFCSEYGTGISGVADLIGSWKVTGYRIGGVSAISEDAARRVLGKVARITKARMSIGRVVCAPKRITIQRVPSRDYLQGGTGPSALDLDVEEEEIAVVRTACEGTPFDTFIVPRQGVLILNWDGAFYILRRVKRGGRGPRSDGM
jgi:hypothetical protein